MGLITFGRIKCFNPRPRTGSDAGRSANGIRVEVGICFNPRPRTGSDETAPVATLCQDSAKLFQSTPPHGERHCPPWHRTIWWASFQSTPRTGSDVLVDPASGTCPTCFNPRPARGATRSGYGADDGLKVSIHAPARGADVLS